MVGGFYVGALVFSLFGCTFGGVEVKLRLEFCEGYYVYVYVYEKPVKKVKDIIVSDL